MKAARYYGPGDIRVEQVPEPQVTKGEIKIKIAWNGICGSDLHAFLTPMTGFFPTKTTANVLSGETLPITLGHEFSGTIVELGSGTDSKKFSVGQNVVVEPVVSCMKTDTCEPCAVGSRNVCEKMSFVGISGWGGGLSEFVSVPEELVHILPDGVPLEIGACIEPLAVAWHAVKRSTFKKGDTAFIAGAGPIGMFTLKALRALDPSTTIIVSEPASIRRDLALEHGATYALNPLETDVRAAAIKATGGKGVDVAFDAAGIQASIDMALLCVKPRGVVMNIAIWEAVPNINMNLVTVKEITITGIVAYDRVHEEVLEAVGSGKISRIDELITSKVAIEDVVEKGFRTLLKDRDTHVKILIHP